MTAIAEPNLFLDFIEDGLVGLRGRDTDATAAVTDPKTWATPGQLAKDLDPTTRQTPALDLIDQALVDVDAGRCDRLMIFMPPQEGKSSRIKVGAVWMLKRNKQRRIVAVSYEQGLANEFGREVRAMITGNQGDEGTLNLGMRIAKDNGSVSSWKLSGNRGGVRSVGIGGGLTGRPADVVFIDDPIKNRVDAESETYRERAKNFWTSTLTTRLAPGAPVIVVLTRWHEDDLAGWLLQRPDAERWRVINIPAEADHDPVNGETDVLGREPGEFMESARTDERTGQPRSATEWRQIKVQAGSRDWQALYQGNPSPPEGGLFKREWFQEYDLPQWVERDDGSRVVWDADEVLASWDLAFKKTAGTDFVVGQVWMRRGADVFLLDQTRGRRSFVETCDEVRRFSARWPQALFKLVEDKANGPAVISALQHTVHGIIAEEPHGSKIARASAITPLVEAGNVWLPAPEIPGCAWVGDFVEEAAGFPTAKHDDQVDAMTQALNRLVLQRLLAGEELVQPEEYDVVERRGFYASPI